MARILNGTVVSAKNNKTIVVRVDRRTQHPIYSKAYIVSKKYHAHDEKNEAELGDSVAIVECPPKSRLKRWNLKEVTKKAGLA
ncbi:TPA: 30S ribosomal protein S17 [Candidatus Saccharibacteria bacterium]|nr:30S ribosomal protein S17 [Candidatus Saccharibacteria bacterium]HIO87391.1 30S ribosomal protein S17 [Candidatus Saccharibacteria bacterium]